MANTTDTTSVFRIVGLITALALVAAGALVYLQSAGGSAAAAELAALSQAIPQHAEDALVGRGGGFNALDANLTRLAELRRNAGGIAPGASDDWRQLESRTAAIVEKRAEVESLNSASAGITTNAAAILALSNDLLNRSSSTAIVQEFQQRADRMAMTARNLAMNDDASTAADAIADDAAFLQNVANALAGGASNLDMRPLNAAGRQAVLVPLTGHLTELGPLVETITANVGSIGGLSQAHADVTQASNTLMGSAFSGSASLGALGLPGALSVPWIPIGLIALALLLVLGLVLVNSRGAIFERMAKEQTSQNERNQQAILRLLDEMGSLADGDLTVEATVTEDITGTIADSFNYAIEELRKLVTTVNETAIMVDSAAKQTESTASHMARAAENQTREINAATESIVSMAASIEEVSGNAERSSDVARHSVEVAHKGGEAVRRTIDGMNTIRETIQETSKRIKRLGESSQEIGNIVELINDIAEQTNILALNASIQASMAGEAGRGFAVVADEVQRLAERSTNATKQIEVLVSTIQADTNEAVVSMERSTTDVVGGALLAENAGAALDEIEQVSNQIASLVQNISGSARQQAGSAADVTRRTKRLGEISGQTGKATTATAAAISKLSEFASQLRKTVAGFTLPKETIAATTLHTTSTNTTAAKGQRQTGTG
ncbi:MAG: methyl-accepting chemotaxis protein [Gammaproteobacteria bacterium]|nr:methyl-accepting chemotaxis protein [Gammaproteobacteria bacterium]